LCRGTERNLSAAAETQTLADDTKTTMTDTIQKITPYLWVDKDAKAVADYRLILSEIFIHF